MPYRSSAGPAKRQCPRCTSRSLVIDYDDDPRKDRAHAYLCLSCGRRFIPTQQPQTAATTETVGSKTR